MEIDLSGKTVTRAMAEMEAALEEGKGEALVFRTDNEVVKLNLYNRLVKLGLKCKLERKGPFHFISTKVPKPDHEIAYEDPPWKPKQNRAKSNGIHRRPREGRSGGGQVPPNKRVATAAGQVPVAKGNPPSSQPVRRNQPGTPSAQPPSVTVKKWVVLAADQIGNRDISFGVDLLEDFLRAVHGRGVAGIMLVHRGARLADPNYEGGRVLALLLGMELPICVCEKSARFYQLDRKLRAPIQAVAFDQWLAEVGVGQILWL